MSLSWSISGLADEHGAPVILVLGDSLSSAYNMPPASGWVALLEQDLRARGLAHRVVNASISGDTTRGGRARIGPALDEYRPAIVVVELGGNDGLRGVSFTEMEANLRAIVDASRGSGARVLMLGVHMPANYGRTFNERFRAVFERVAQDTQSVLVPGFLDGITDDVSYMQEDLLHPNEKAQPILLDNVMPHLLPLLETTAPASRAAAPRAQRSH